MYICVYLHVLKIINICFCHIVCLFIDLYIMHVSYNSIFLKEKSTNKTTSLSYFIYIYIYRQRDIVNVFISIYNHIIRY